MNVKKKVAEAKRRRRFGRKIRLVYYTKSLEDTCGFPVISEEFEICLEEKSFGFSES